jgi:hypothetical protein
MPGQNIFLAKFCMGKQKITNPTYDLECRYKVPVIRKLIALNSKCIDPSRAQNCRKQKTFLGKRRSANPKTEPRSHNQKNWLFFVKIPTRTEMFSWFCKKQIKGIIFCLETWIFGNFHKVCIFCQQIYTTKKEIFTFCRLQGHFSQLICFVTIINCSKCYCRI